MATRPSKVTRTLLKVSAVLLASLLVTLLIFELIYRWQLVDTYGADE